MEINIKNTENLFDNLPSDRDIRVNCRKADLNSWTRNLHFLVNTWKYRNNTNSTMNYVSGMFRSILKIIKLKTIIYIKGDQ